MRGEKFLFQLKLQKKERETTTANNLKSKLKLLAGTILAEDIHHLRGRSPDYRGSKTPGTERNGQAAATTTTPRRRSKRRGATMAPKNGPRGQAVLEPCWYIANEFCYLYVFGIFLLRGYISFGNHIDSSRLPFRTSCHSRRESFRRRARQLPTAPLHGSSSGQWISWACGGSVVLVVDLHETA